METSLVSQQIVISYQYKFPRSFNFLAWYNECFSIKESKTLGIRPASAFRPSSAARTHSSDRKLFPKGINSDYDRIAELEAKLEAETQLRKSLEHDLATMTTQRNSALEKLRVSESCRVRLETVLKTFKNKLRRSMNRRRGKLPARWLRKSFALFWCQRPIVADLLWLWLPIRMWSQGHRLIGTNYGWSDRTSSRSTYYIGR